MWSALSEPSRLHLLAAAPRTHCAINSFLLLLGSSLCICAHHFAVFDFNLSDVPKAVIGSSLLEYAWFTVHNAVISFPSHNSITGGSRSDLSLVTERPDNALHKEWAELILIFKSRTKENSICILIVGHWTSVLKPSGLLSAPYSHLFVVLDYHDFSHQCWAAS